MLYAVGGRPRTPAAAHSDTAFLWTSTGGMTRAAAAGRRRRRYQCGHRLGDHPRCRVYRQPRPIQSGRHGAAPCGPRNDRKRIGDPRPRRAAGFPQTAPPTRFRATARSFTDSPATTIAGQTAGRPLYGGRSHRSPRSRSSTPATTRVCRRRRGTSSDGSVMVGTSANSATDGGNLYGPGNAAFRYVEGVGVSAIPFLRAAPGTQRSPVPRTATSPWSRRQHGGAQRRGLSVQRHAVDRHAFGTPAAGWMLQYASAA